MGCCDSTSYQLDKEKTSFSRNNQFELYAAIIKQDVDELDNLRKKGFVMNYRMPHFSYRAPLHIAAQIGSKDVILFLLKNNANPDIQDKQGVTPGMLAAQNRHKDCVLLLDNVGANMSLKNIFGMKITDYMLSDDRG